MKLYCFSSAGGSSTIFWNLKKDLTGIIDVIPIDYPGHGKRYSEQLLINIDEIIDDIYSKIEFSDDEYSLLGYSMGAWVAYELYYKIREMNKKQPEQLIFCSQDFPKKTLNKDKTTKNMSDDSFYDYLVELGGIPKEIQDENIFSIFLPILRADYNVVENYNPIERKELVECKVAVITGTEDLELIQKGRPETWTKFAKSKVNYFEIDGDHFFINEHHKELSSIIKTNILGEDEQY